MVDYRIEFTMEFFEGLNRNFWFDFGKMLRKLKRRELYLRRYRQRGKRMNKQ